MALIYLFHQQLSLTSAAFQLKQWINGQPDYEHVRMHVCLYVWAICCVCVCACALCISTKGSNGMAWIGCDLIRPHNWRASNLLKCLLMLRQNPLQIRIVCCTSGNCNASSSSSREDCKWVTFAKSLRRQRGVCVILIDVQLMCSRKQILRRVFGRRCHLCGLRYNSKRLGVRGARTHMQRS